MHCSAAYVGLLSPWLRVFGDGGRSEHLWRRWDCVCNSRSMLGKTLSMISSARLAGIQCFSASKLLHGMQGGDSVSFPLILSPISRVARVIAWDVTVDRSASCALDVSMQESGFEVSEGWCLRGKRLEKGIRKTWCHFGGPRGVESSSSGNGMLGTLMKLVLYVRTTLLRVCWAMASSRKRL